MKNLCLPLLLAIMCLNTHLFGQKVDLQQFEQKISQTIYLTHGIMAQSPEIIKFQDAEKIYIDEQFVE